MSEWTLLVGEWLVSGGREEGRKEEAGADTAL